MFGGDELGRVGGLGVKFQDFLTEYSTNNLGYLVDAAGVEVVLLFLQ